MSSSGRLNQGTEEERLDPNQSDVEAHKQRLERDQSDEETRKELLERDLDELLQELRVVLPGVQVLFAFLLIVPFNQGFEKLTSGEVKVYFGTLLCTALASLFLMAPSAQHRILFRQGDKDHLLKVSNRYSIAGLSMLVTAICGSLFLITALLFSDATALITTAAAVALFGTLWFVLPLRRSRRLATPER